MNVSNATPESDDSLVRQMDPVSIMIFMTIAELVIFVVGVVGNVVTCVVIAYGRSMRTTTDCYLFNLAVSDLLLLVVGVPHDIFRMWYPLTHYFGDVGCFVVSWTMETSVNVSVLTITTFTIERYLAICRPFVAHAMSHVARAARLILVIWAVSFLCATFVALHVRVLTTGEESTCVFNVDRLPYTIESCTIVFFVLPMLIISVLYAMMGVKLVRSKRKMREEERGSTKRVLKMLVTVVVVFFVCWAPFHVQRLLTLYYLSQAKEKGYSDADLILSMVVFYLAGVMYFFSAAINPVIYNLMSNKFREDFKGVFSKCEISWVMSQRKCSYGINKNNNDSDVADTPI